MYIIASFSLIFHTSNAYCQINIQNHPNIDVVVFDLSGTIVDSCEQDKAAINKVLLKYSNTDWETVKHKKNPLHSIKESFKIFIDKNNVEKAHREYIDLMIKNISNTSLVTGAKELLEYLYKLEIKTVLVTNRDINYVNFVLDYYNIKKYFSSIITPDTTGLFKANYQIRNFFNRSDEIFVIGDSYSDFVLASNLNAFPILLLNKTSDITQENIDEWKLKKINIEYIKDHYDLLYILKNKIAK